MIRLRTSYEISDVEQDMDVDPELLEHVQKEFERQAILEEEWFLKFLAATQEPQKQG